MDDTARRDRPADACLIDIDGTVYQDGAAIPGAAAAVAALRRAGIPFRFTTNTTRKPRSAIVATLRGLGIETSVDECLTAPLAAVEHLKAQGVRRILPLFAEATREEFSDFTIDPERPEQVVVGDLGEGWTYEVMNRAFRALFAGAGLIAIQRNRYWRTAGGLALDAGPFIAALEYATGQEAVLVGKPSVSFFDAAVARLGVPKERIAVVGDDPETDVRGARDAGLVAVGLRTGKFRPADEKRLAQADAVLDSIADLPRWLGVGG